MYYVFTRNMVYRWVKIHASSNSQSHAESVARLIDGAYVCWGADPSNSPRENAAIADYSAARK